MAIATRLVRGRRIRIRQYGASHLEDTGLGKPRMHRAAAKSIIAADATRTDGYLWKPSRHSSSQVARWVLDRRRRGNNVGRVFWIAGGG